jgi:hypothetical protein
MKSLQSNLKSMILSDHTYREYPPFVLVGFVPGSTEKGVRVEIKPPIVVAVMESTNETSVLTRVEGGMPLRVVPSRFIHEGNALPSCLVAVYLIARDPHVAAGLMLI